jgi:two-component system LytT family response regulator
MLRTGGTVTRYDVLSPLTLMGRANDRTGAAAAEGVPTEREGAGYLERITIRARNRILFLDAREVAWLEAYGNYVRFHVIPTDGGEPAVHTVRATLSSYVTRLDPRRFLRIHRSVIVNVDVVRELHARRTGDFTLITRSGERLTLSRNFRTAVPELRRLLAAS